jgi:uncharacterized membrane protein YgaE (UPF0421/DUF939 family)
MLFFEIIDGIVDLVTSWRLYLCIAIGALLAYFLHTSFPEQNWTYFISVPLVIFMAITGWGWQNSKE